MTSHANQGFSTNPIYPFTIPPPTLTNPKTEETASAFSTSGPWTVTSQANHIFSNQIPFLLATPLPPNSNTQKTEKEKVSQDRG